VHISWGIGPKALVDGHQFRLVIHQFKDIVHVGDGDAGNALLAVGNDAGGIVTGVVAVFEYLHQAAGDLCPADPFDQFLALAAEHGPADDLDPAGFSIDDLHRTP